MHLNDQLAIVIPKITRAVIGEDVVLVVVPNVKQFKEQVLEESYKRKPKTLNPERRLELMLIATIREHYGLKYRRLTIRVVQADKHGKYRDERGYFVAEPKDPRIVEAAPAEVEAAPAEVAAEAV